MLILLFIKEENKMVLIYAITILYILVSNWITVFSKEKQRYLLSLVPYVIMVGGVGLRLLILQMAPFPSVFIDSDIEIFGIVLTMGLIGLVITSTTSLITKAVN
jgi:hypothetical protein